jgi:hypothetical protein
MKGALALVLSASRLLIALKYGLVGGGVTSKQERPILYWIGVAVTALLTCVACGLGR